MLPLHYGLQLGMQFFKHGFEYIVHANFSALTVPDSQTGLLPFLLAAARNAEVPTIYFLILERRWLKPHLLEWARHYIS